MKARQAVEISMGAVDELALLGNKVVPDGGSLVKAAVELVLNTLTPLFGAAGSEPLQDESTRS